MSAPTGSTLLAAAFALAQTGLAHVDLDGNVIRANAELVALTGLPAHSVIGRPLDEVLPDVPPGTTNLLPEAEPLQAAGTGPDGRRRDLRISALPLPDATGTTVGHLIGVADVTEALADARGRRRLVRQLSLLAAIGELLDDELDEAATLAAVGRIAVERLADWCVVAIPGADGNLRCVHAAHRIPGRTRLLRELVRSFPGAPLSAVEIDEVHARGRPLLRTSLPDAPVEAPQARELLHALEPRSALVVPVRARGETLGTLTLVSARPARPFDRDDVATATELGRRAAFALQAARRYGASGRALARAETTVALQQHAQRSLQADVNRRQIVQDVSQLLQDVRDPRRAVTGTAEALVPWIADRVRVTVHAPTLGALEHETGAPEPSRGGAVPIRRVHRARSGTRVTVEVTGAWWTSSGAPDDEDARLLQDVTERLAAACLAADLYAQQAATAATLQGGLLPAELPRVPGMSLCARYAPAGGGASVGGDFYDVMPLPDDEWLFVVGDVCGKGAAAAVVTAQARHTLRALAPGAPAPADALRALNGVLHRERTDGRFVTACAVRVHPVKDGRARAEVACAGHPAPVLVRADGRGDAVPADGQLLGVLDAVRLTPVELSLERGDVLALYTDGVSEADPHDAVEAAELAAAVAPAAAGGPFGVAGAIERHARDRAAGGQLPDDVAVLAFALDR